MAIQFAPLIMAGGKAALSKLPLIMGVGAALPSLSKGRPVEAALQGGLGYLGGGALAGPANRLVPRMAGGIAGALQKVAPGLASSLGANLTPTAAGLASLGLGAGALALGGASNQVADPVVQGTKQALGAGAQTGAGLIGYTAQGQPVYNNIGGAAVPPVGMYGGMSPYGSPLDVLGPAGMGQRLQTIKDAETMRDAMRLLNPEILAASEARSKKEFERNMAAAGIRQNIATRAAMIQKAQEAGLRAGLTAAEQSGRALTQQYQYQ